MVEGVGGCPLTPREMDVVRRLALPNAQIAGGLGIAYHTVKNVITAIGVKMLGYWSPRRGTGMRTLLLALALKWGWITLGEVVLDADSDTDIRIGEWVVTGLSAAAAGRVTKEKERER